MAWGETALYAIGKELTHHQQNTNLLMLEEAKMGAEALVAIIDELIKRQNNA